MSEAKGSSGKAAAAPQVLVGVCGGVAAYKAAELVRALQQQGVRCRW